MTSTLSIWYSGNWNGWAHPRNSNLCRAFRWPQASYPLQSHIIHNCLHIIFSSGVFYNKLFNSAWFIIYRMPHTLLPLFVFGQIWGWCRVQLNLRCFVSTPHSVLFFRLQVASGAFHCESFACALSKSLCMPIFFHTHARCTCLTDVQRFQMDYTFGQSDIHRKETFCSLKMGSK